MECNAKRPRNESEKLTSLPRRTSYVALVETSRAKSVSRSGVTTRARITYLTTFHEEGLRPRLISVIAKKCGCKKRPEVRNRPVDGAVL